LAEHILDDIILSNAPCVPNVVGTKKLFIKEFDILNVNIIFQTMT
jgi:hypothetical protein